MKDKKKTKKRMRKGPKAGHNQVEGTLEELHAFLQSVIDGIDGSIMVIGLDHRIKSMNLAARESMLRGRSDSESLKYCYQLSHRQDAPCNTRKHPCPIEEVRKSGQTVVVEHMHKDADGKDRFFEIVASPLRAPDGTITGIVESMRDITERKKAEDKINELLNFNESIVSSAPVGIVTVDIKGSVTHANRAFLEMVGSPSLEETLKLGMQIPSVKKAGIAEAFKKTMTTGEPFELYKVPYASHWGKELILNIRGVPRKAKDGSITGVIVVVEDVTDRAMAEETLQESEVFLSSIFMGIQDGISVLDEDLNIIRANPTMAGWYPHAMPLAGKKCYQAYHGRSEPCESCPACRTLETSEAAYGVVPKRGPDWEIIGWLDVYSFPLIDAETDRAKGVIEYVHDITERKAAEDEIKTLKEFNENIVQHMKEGIIVENDEGFITFVNPRMSQMLGVTKDELVGKHWTEIFSSDFESKVREGNSLVREGSTARYEVALDIGDREMQAMVSATPLIDEDLYIGNLKVFVDITERKEAEERLRQRALKYRIERGSSYLITEKVMDKSLDVFTDLTQAGYKGMIITRTPPKKFEGRIEGNVDMLWLGEEKKGKGVIPPKLSLLTKSIEDFLSRDTVVLLDRLDYLIVQKDFNRVLKLLHKLSEMVYLAKAVLLIAVDPDTLSKQEFSLLEKDIPKVEAKYQVEMDRELIEILEFVKKETEDGRKPVHKDVMKAFGITQPTATKRLKELKNKGLLLEKKRGRFKTLELTERGKETI